MPLIDPQPMPQFDQVAACLYLQEACELIDALLFALDKLEQARAEWLASHAQANEQAGRRRTTFDSEAFYIAMNAIRREQSNVFDAIEAFLGSWARLSLLFWPVPRKSAIHHVFTIERGRILRHLLDLTEDHPLADRRLRDAWMHTDERFDQAWLENRLGNRQQFVRTGGVDAAIRHAVRVVDVESLTVHFREAGGNVASRPLLPLREVLNDLLVRHKAAFEGRLLELPIAG